VLTTDLTHIKVPRIAEKLMVDDILFGNEINVKPINGKRVSKIKKDETPEMFRKRLLFKIASTDKYKPIYKGVFHDLDVDVATDGLVLITLSAANNSTWLESVKGDEIKGKFPNYKAAIKEYGNGKFIASINAPNLISNLAGIMKATDFIYNATIKARIKLCDKKGNVDYMYVNAPRIYKAVMCLLADGAKIDSLVFRAKSIDSPLVITDNDNDMRVSVIVPCDPKSKYLYKTI